MAVTFSSQGCRQAASDLLTAANRVDSLLNQDLTNSINQVKGAYESETASELYAAFDKVKAKFPEFIDSINECANYLANTVAPAYEDLEAKAASKIN